MKNWTPIPARWKKTKRQNKNIKSYLSKKRADHRSCIIKDWAKELESNLEPKVPGNYVSPFDENKCIYCLCKKGKSPDEFRPSAQLGRMNIVNCVPCCGTCNSKKGSKCGTKLIEWIEKYDPITPDNKEKIIKWYMENEKYMILDENTILKKYNKTIKVMIEEELDKILDNFYRSV